MTAKQIMHPADAKALQVLKQARGLNRLIKYYMEKGDECVARGENLGTMLMVTEENNDDQTVYHIKINASGLQKAIDEKGLYSIVTSDPMSPEEVHRLYSCRGVSETQYMQTKTQFSLRKKPGPKAKFV